MFLTIKVMVATNLVTWYTQPQNTTAVPSNSTKTLNNSPDLAHHNIHTPPFHENAAKPRNNNFTVNLTHYRKLIIATTHQNVYMGQYNSFPQITTCRFFRMSYCSSAFGQRVARTTPLMNVSCHPQRQMRQTCVNTVDRSATYGRRVELTYKPRKEMLPKHATSYVRCYRCPLRAERC